MSPETVRNLALSGMARFFPLMLRQPVTATIGAIFFASFLMVVVVPTALFVAAPFLGAYSIYRLVRLPLRRRTW